MTYVKRGLTALGLCISASLALVAFAAPAAHAVPPEWTIEGKTMSELSLNKAPLEGELAPGTDFRIETKIESTLLAIECSNLELDEGLLLKGGEATFVSLFTSCKTMFGESEAGACQPIEPVALDERLLLILHGNKIYALVDPNAEANLFGEIEFGEECVLPTAEVSGSFVYECPTGKEPAGLCDTEQEDHELLTDDSVSELFEGQEEEGQTLPYDEFFFMNTPARWYQRVILRLALFLEGHRWKGAV